MRREDKIKVEKTLIPLIEYYFNNNQYYLCDELVYGDFLETAYERNYVIPYKIAKQTWFRYRTHLIKILIKKHRKSIDNFETK